MSMKCPCWGCAWIRRNPDVIGPARQNAKHAHRLYAGCFNSKNRYRLEMRRSYRRRFDQVQPRIVNSNSVVTSDARFSSKSDMGTLPVKRTVSCVPARQTDDAPICTINSSYFLCRS